MLHKIPEYSVNPPPPPPPTKITKQKQKMVYILQTFSWCTVHVQFIFSFFNLFLFQLAAQTTHMDHLVKSVTVALKGPARVMESVMWVAPLYFGCMLLACACHASQWETTNTYLWYFRVPSAEYPKLSLCQRLSLPGLCVHYAWTKMEYSFVFIACCWEFFLSIFLPSWVFPGSFSIPPPPPPPLLPSHSHICHLNRLSLVIWWVVFHPAVTFSDGALYY